MMHEAFDDRRNGCETGLLHRAARLMPACRTAFEMETAMIPFADGRLHLHTGPVAQVEINAPDRLPRDVTGRVAGHSTGLRRD